MERKDILPIASAIFILIIVLAGEVVVNTNSHNDFHSSVSDNGDSLNFTIESGNSHTYEVVSLKDSLGTPESLSIYYDESYYSMASDGIASTGGRSLDQEYYVEQMLPTMKVRGISDISTLDAQGLKDLMSAEGKGHAVIFISGALPDTVYDGTEDSPIFDWISSGGRLYWLGGVLGKYIAHQDSVDTVHNGTTLFLGSECIDDEHHDGDKEITSNGFRDALFLQSHGTTFGVKPAELPSDSVFQSMGYTEGERASITLVSYGNGVVCVLGGEYTIRQRNDLAQIIASGVGPETEIADLVNGSVSGKANGTIAKGDSVFITLGGFYTVYCENHEVTP